MAGIHVLNFKDEIIDFISYKDNYVRSAKLTRNSEEKTDTFDFVIDSNRAENLRERNRIVVQDQTGKFREYIISDVNDSYENVTEVNCDGSYLEDLKRARPIPPNKLVGNTTSQALLFALANTFWEVSDETEYGGSRSTSWTSYTNPYDLIYQLCTTYSMVADFYIVLGSNSVEGRFVTLKTHKPLFKGKEIVNGVDLTDIKRTVDYSEVKTALLAVGPEPEQDKEIDNDKKDVKPQVEKKRLEIAVYDNEAQRVFGLPGHYLWDVYEPETEDNNMSEQRLKTLAITELNKRKKAAISYEITSLDLNRNTFNSQYNETADIGDLIRVKDVDFNPPLYIETEIFGIEYDPISNETTFTFGDVIEYKQNELRKEFQEKMNSINKKMNDEINPIKKEVKQQSDKINEHDKTLIKLPTELETKLSKVDYTEDKRKMLESIREENNINSNNFEEKLSNVQVGGRNLLLDSNVLKKNNDYSLAEYKLSRQIPIGTQVSISLKGNLGAGRTYFLFINSIYGDTNNNLATFNNSNLASDGIYRATFTWKGNTAPNDKLLVYAAPNNQSTSESYIEWIKLELGNKVTDYTVAPEDNDKKIESLAAKVDRLTQLIDTKNGGQT